MRPSPGTVAVFYGGGKLSAPERKMKVAELALRCAICGFGVLAAAVIGFDSQVREFFSVERKARFTYMKALVFLVAVDGTAAGYSLVQAVRCAVSMMRRSVLCNRALAWAIFACDQATAYLTLAAVAAAAQLGVIGKFGQLELQWMELCGFYGKFCTQAGVGLVSSFLVSLCAAALSGVSALNLFRLYGKNKEGYGGRSRWQFFYFFAGSAGAATRSNHRRVALTITM